MIREATLDDIPALLEMGRAFADRCDLHSIAPYDETSMAATFRLLIEQDNGILLITDGGAAGGMVHPAYWNHAHLTGQEFFWWVYPEKRGQGVRLFKALEQAAKDRGAGSWAMITLDKVEPEKTGRFYERCGYRKSEHSFIKVF